MSELKDLIRKCKFTKRIVLKGKKVEPTEDTTKGNDSYSPLQPEWVDVYCCVLMRKPIEKILIRYEKVPDNYLSAIDRHFYSISPAILKNNATTAVSERMPVDVLAALSRYMHHQRWVWVTQQGTADKLALPFMAKILSTLTK